METTTVIDHVEIKTGQGAKGAWKLYKVKTHEGYMSTFDEATGVTAQSLSGQTATINYHIKNKDGYDNMIIDNITGAGGAAPAQQPQSAPQTSQSLSKDKSIVYSYAKDIVVALVAKGLLKDTDDLANTVSRIGDELFMRLTQTDPVGDDANGIPF